MEIQSIQNLLPYASGQAQAQAKTQGTPNGTENDAESSFSLPVQKELTDEEKKRVEQLKGLIAQLLSSADSPPTEAQANRIRQVEKEIEKITGVKTSSSVGKTMLKMPGRDDDEKEKWNQKWKSRFEAEQQARAATMPESKEGYGPGLMAFLQANAANAYTAQSQSASALPSSMLNSMKI